MLSNVATGEEFHKEAVLNQLIPHAETGAQAYIIKFLQSNNSRLRTAAVWTVVNLTNSLSPGAVDRLEILRGAGIVSQIKTMVNDPCVDVKVINLLSQTGWIFVGHFLSVC